MAAHDVVQNYARRLMILNEGMSAGDAVEAAYAQVVDFSLYPTSVNGRDTIIPKEVGSTHFTEEQLPDMAAALQKGIDLFDSRDVDTSHFPREVSMLVDPVKREAAIRRVILEKARVSVSSDGRSMQLLVSDDTGNPYLLTDKAGRPYQVDIAEDLARSRPRLVLPPETNWDSTQVYQLRLDDPNFSWRTTDVPSTSLTYWPLLKAE